jgi:L-ornithine N5-oxygenase
VILATGYERRSHRDLLAPLQGYLQDFSVERDYRAWQRRAAGAGVPAGLLRNQPRPERHLAVGAAGRAAEIGESLYQALAQRRGRAPHAAAIALTRA